MVDPEWRSLRPPKQVFTNYTNVHNPYDVNQNYLPYSKHGFEVNKNNNHGFLGQGYEDHNDIFKEDSVVDMQFPNYCMGNRWLYYESNKEQHLTASIEPLNTYYNSENQSSCQKVTDSPVNIVTNNCCNEENDLKPIIVPTQDAGGLIDIRNSGPLERELSALATNSILCEVNTVHSLPSHFNNALPDGANLTRAQRRALRRRRWRLNKKKKKHDKDHVYIQCRVSRKLLTEIISSSITVNGRRLCL